MVSSPTAQAPFPPLPQKGPLAMQQARPGGSAVPPRSVEFPLCDVSLTTLSKFYSAESARAIVHLITEFLPYVPNFQPIVGTIKEPTATTVPSGECSGPPLLFLVCPLLVQCRDGTKSVVVVHVGFPRSYPSCTVTAALAIPSNGRVRDHHATINSNGVIRLAGLPLLRSAKAPYTLCELLLAITDTCEEAFPFVPLAEPVALPSPELVSTASPVSVRSSAAGVPSGGRLPTPASAAVVAPPASAPPPPVRSLVRQAAESLIVHLGRFGIPEYLEARDCGSSVLQQLQTDHDAMSQHLCATIGPQKQSLVETKQTLVALLEMVAVTAPRVLESTKDVVEPADDVAAGVFPLLAELQAQDDLYACDEVLLKKGKISAEEFVKSVSEVARAQFWCRYRFQRLMQRTPSTVVSKEGPQKVSPQATNTIAVGSAPVSAGAQSTTISASASPSNAPSPSAAVAPQPSRTPVVELAAEFPQLDEGLIEDVFAATKSLPLARLELRAMAGMS